MKTMFFYKNGTGFIRLWWRELHFTCNIPKQLKSGLHIGRWTISYKPKDNNTVGG